MLNSYLISKQDWV